MVAGYTGHGANTGGLQQHSLGDLYPYTIIAKGDCSRGKAALSWHALDCRSGSEGPARRSYREAELDVHSAKIRNCMHG